MVRVCIHLLWLLLLKRLLLNVYKNIEIKITLELGVWCGQLHWDIYFKTFLLSSNGIQTEQRFLIPKKCDCVTIQCNAILCNRIQCNTLNAMQCLRLVLNIVLLPCRTQMKSSFQFKHGSNTLFESIKHGTAEFGSAWLLSMASLSVLHGSSTTCFQTASYCCAELNS